jgi:hypothetical protein
MCRVKRSSEVKAQPCPPAERSLVLHRGAAVHQRLVNCSNGALSCQPGSMHAELGYQQAVRSCSTNLQWHHALWVRGLGLKPCKFWRVPKHQGACGTYLDARGGPQGTQTEHRNLLLVICIRVTCTLHRHASECVHGSDRSTGSMHFATTVQLIKAMNTNVRLFNRSDMSVTLLVWFVLTTAARPSNGATPRTYC